MFYLHCIVFIAYGGYRVLPPAMMEICYKFWSCRGWPLQPRSSVGAKDDEGKERMKMKMMKKKKEKNERNKGKDSKCREQMRGGVL